MAKIDGFVGALTSKETVECAAACLEQMDPTAAWEFVKQWIYDSGFEDDAGVEFSLEPDDE